VTEEKAKEVDVSSFSVIISASVLLK